jgi:hypothetical protein
MVRLFTYNCNKKVKMKKGLLILSALTMMIVEMSFAQSNIAVKDTLSAKELGEFPYFTIHTKRPMPRPKSTKRSIFLVTPARSAPLKESIIIPQYMQRKVKNITKL